MNTEVTRTKNPVGSDRPAHRCPVWMHHLLANPLRKLVEAPEKLVGPHVRPGMTVLEPGCGFGFFSLPMAQMVGPGGKLLCVDVEPEAVARLRRRAEKAGLSARIEARLCSPKSLGLDEWRGRVDLVTVIHALHEFEDVPGFLAQAGSLLKPDGRMLVIEPKGHVSPQAFSEELAVCRSVGFREVPYDGAPKNRLIALLGRV